jgi:hypothetical protein
VPRRTVVIASLAVCRILVVLAFVAAMGAPVQARCAEDQPASISEVIDRLAPHGGGTLISFSTVQLDPYCWIADVLVAGPVPGECTKGHKITASGTAAYDGELTALVGLPVDVLIATTFTCQ